MTELPADAGCRRCGTCCLKGGPALHRVDRELVDSGWIPLKDLFTIRQGEPAFDNVRGRCVPAPTDIIKIVGSNDQTKACLYYDAVNGLCSIYTHHPLECRALSCRETAALEAIYNDERLTRRDLLGSVEGLWDLVSDHHVRCGYDRVADLVARLKTSWSTGIVDDLLYMIRYDQSLREEIRERACRQVEHSAFLLGFPLTETICRFGLRLTQGPGGVTLEWIGG
jgi:Fe-S-cluster containining protein